MVPVLRRKTIPILDYSVTTDLHVVWVVVRTDHVIVESPDVHEVAVGVERRLAHEERRLVYDHVCVGRLY